MVLPWRRVRREAEPGRRTEEKLVKHGAREAKRRPGGGGSVVSTSFQATEESLHDFLTLFVLRSKRSMTVCCFAPLTPHFPELAANGKRKKHVSR